MPYICEGVLDTVMGDKRPYNKGEVAIWYLPYHVILSFGDRQLEIIYFIY